MKRYLLGSAVSAVALIGFASIASAAIIVPPPVQQYPTDKDQCKKGGWEDFGGIFKNQGDCVSYVVTNGRNQPANL